MAVAVVAAAAAVAAAVVVVVVAMARRVVEVQRIVGRVRVPGRIDGDKRRWTGLLARCRSSDRRRTIKLRRGGILVARGQQARRMRGVGAEPRAGQQASRQCVSRVIGPVRLSSNQTGARAKLRTAGVGRRGMRQGRRVCGQQGVRACGQRGRSSSGGV